MPSRTNRWTELARNLAREGREQAKRVAEAERGGSSPPFRQHLTRWQQLRIHQLLAQPVETLTPEEAAEADLIWGKMFKGQSREDVAEFVLEMEALKLRTAGVPQPMAPAGVEEEALDGAMPQEGENVTV